MLEKHFESNAILNQKEKRKGKQIQILKKKLIKILKISFWFKQKHRTRKLRDICTRFFQTELLTNKTG